MAKITLKQLTVRNFKGFTNKTVNFGPVTDIYGKNESGKTTLMDAFLWCLFGRNSQGVSDFNVKPLDKNNNPLTKLEYEVSLLIDVDGIEFPFTRTLREKWAKVRGSTEEAFGGHETTYYVHGVPMQKREYDAKVNSIFPEAFAKLITNPLHFYTLKWQDRRQILMAMAGKILDVDILAGLAPAERELLGIAIGQHKAIDDWKKELAAKKAKIKAEKDTIPTRIAESQRQIEQIGELDYPALELQLTAKNAEIASVNEQIENSTTALRAGFEKVNIAQAEKQQLQRKLQEIKNEAEAGKAQALAKISIRIKELTALETAQKRSIATCTERINTILSAIKNLENETAGLRDKYSNIDAEDLVIDPSSLECPACKRALEPDKIEELKSEFASNFNTDKERRLSEVKKKGVSNNEQVKALEQEIKELEASKRNMESEMSKWTLESLVLKEDEIKLNQQTVTLPKAAAELEKQIAAVVIPESPILQNETLKADRAKLQAEADTLKDQLRTKEFKDRLTARIDELLIQERTLAHAINDIEAQEYAAQMFTKAKVNEVESRINSKFKIVKWKMFLQQINGEEIECCEALVDGVPWADVNTAGKINAGLDIVNALSEHYNCYAPVWIDNRESITSIIPTNTQIINLIVSPADEALRVVSSSIKDITLGQFQKAHA